MILSAEKIAKYILILLHKYILVQSTNVQERTTNSIQLFDCNVSFSSEKSTVTQHDIFTRLHKVPFLQSHAHHAHVLHCFPHTVLPQSFLLGFGSLTTVFFPPSLSSVWNLCFCLLIFTQVYYIFSMTRRFFCMQIIIVFLLSICTVYL